jgi:hypothetical protein
MDTDPHPIVLPEIEITPEMVDAGFVSLCESGALNEDGYLSPSFRYVAEDIIRAAWRVAPWRVKNPTFPD